MRRTAAILLITVALSACSAFVDSVQQNTQAKLQQFLTNQFAQQIESGIDFVISQLGAKGGYLDDPLVRILLPPPLGLVIGVARDLQTDPQATLLQILINQAAENAIPVAGPILKNIVMNMDTSSLESVLNSGGTTATDYLKEKGGAALQAALLPAITKELHANGAIELYGELLKVKEQTDQITTTATDVQQPLGPVERAPAVTQEQLGQYVAEQAATGLFKKVADKELSIREGLSQQGGAGK